MFDIARIIFLKFRRVWAGKRRLRKRILGQPPSPASTIPPSPRLMRNVG